jgi:dipeptidyl aminopeptidase/acylaminoacyl peptidase
MSASGSTTRDTTDRSTPAWERRYRAPTMAFPDFSPEAPDRCVYAGTESGVWQVHVWDRGTGLRRQVTSHPVGVVDGAPTLDGDGVLFWQDETGDESGQWYVEAFEGGDARPFLEGAPHGWNEGFAQAAGVVAAAISDRDGFAVHVAVDGGPAKELLRSTESIRIAGAESGGFNRGGLSPDGELLCLEHSEHGDLIHPALRVIDARTGATVGEQLDRGLALSAWSWSPVPGDHRLAMVHEREGEERPAIWNLDTGERTDLSLDLPGIVVPYDWWPDASALLVVNYFEGRDTVYRYDLATAGLTKLDFPDGYLSGARVRPDGSVWVRMSDSVRQSRILTDGGEEVVRAEGERAPDGRPFANWHFQNPHGQIVHGFHVSPPGDGPFPVIMLVHGGPTWYDADRFYPEAQAYVDAGFAVGLVNYRGSVGYGREWRDTLIGNIGGPELEDVNAGLQDLVAHGIADPERAVIAGWSWGGYTTLMELGKHPELWLCGVAGVPVGDYELSYEDMSPLLQAYDRALLGGAPKDVPELMLDRNPINFADRVTAPVMFVIGENDSRCPYHQAMAYVEKIAARDHPHELYVFTTGHSSFDVDETVRQQKAILTFLGKHVPGITVRV